MKSGKMIPMSVPAIGQQQYDIRQAMPKRCECGGELFDKAVRVGMISRMALGNRTGMDIIAETPVGYVCRDCGKILDVFTVEKAGQPE